MNSYIYGQMIFYNSQNYSMGKVETFQHIVVRELDYLHAREQIWTPYLKLYTKIKVDQRPECKS